jgi:hypothetical protein
VLYGDGAVVWCGEVWGKREGGSHLRRNSLAPTTTAAMALAGPSNLRLGLRLLTTRTAAPPAARTGKRTGSKEHRTAGPTRRAALAREHAAATTRFPINQPESAQPYAARRLLTHEKKRPTPTLAPIKASVVYENEHFLVLNKPSGVAIQGQHGSTARRMWDALLDGQSRSSFPSPSLFVDLKSFLLPQMSRVDSNPQRCSLSIDWIRWVVCELECERTNLPHLRTVNNRLSRSRQERSLGLETHPAIQASRDSAELYRHCTWRDAGGFQRRDYDEVEDG